MRLGQFARKIDVPLQKVISYLDEAEASGLHANSSLTPEMEQRLMAIFAPDADHVPPMTTREAAPTPPQKLTEPEVKPDDQVSDTPKESEVAPSIDVAASPEAPATSVEAADLPETIPADLSEASPKAPEKAIATDRLMELLESEDGAEGLKGITLIKAPKKELGGLKVVGKIDLPEPKPKRTEKSENSDQEDNPARGGRHARKVFSEEERQKRRERARQKKQEAEARKAARQKEKELREIKARKQAHYQQKVKRQPPKANQDNTPRAPQRVMPEIINEQPENTSWLSRFWKWLNT